jgi:ATP synthase F1 delta subunit
MSSLSIQYSKALYNVAKEFEIEDLIYSQLNDSLLIYIFSKENLKKFFNPFFNEKDSFNFLLNLLSKNGLSFNHIVVNFFSLIFSKKYLINIFWEILKHFNKLYEKDKKIATVKVILACKIDDYILENIKNKISKIIIANYFNYSFILDPDIIGGYKIYHEDSLYDFSISKKIKILSSLFKTNENKT